MMLKLFRITVILIGIIVTAGFSSCRDDEPVTEYITDSTHTLLIYMVGDDRSMNDQFSDNMAQIMKGLKNAPKPLNLVIYQDKFVDDNLPVLFQLKKRVDSNKVDTVYLKKWKNDLDSTDPDFMASVAKLTFKTFNSPIKGFEYWGHGLSWIPGNKFQIPDTTGTRAMEYVGIDHSNKSDIWEMNEALENIGLHLDYMAFDACNMGMAEVAYEFRHLTDYILASPSEIMIKGFPYCSIIEALSTISDEETLLDGLTLAYNAYKEEYNGRDNSHHGTMSLIYTPGLEHLRQACLHLERQAQSGLALWQENPACYESLVQQYGRKDTYINTLYLFYDIQDWADNLCSLVEGLNGAEVRDALEDCVLLHYNTEWFLNRKLSYSCGLGMSIPQFWGLSKYEKLDAAYKHLQWQL